MPTIGPTTPQDLIKTLLQYAQQAMDYTPTGSAPNTPKLGEVVGQVSGMNKAMAVPSALQEFLKPLSRKYPEVNWATMLPLGPGGWGKDTEEIMKKLLVKKATGMVDTTKKGIANAKMHSTWGDVAHLQAEAGLNPKGRRNPERDMQTLLQAADTYDKVGNSRGFLTALEKENAGKVLNRLDAHAGIADAEGALALRKQYLNLVKRPLDHTPDDILAYSHYLNTRIDDMLGGQSHRLSPEALKHARRVVLGDILQNEEQTNQLLQIFEHAEVNRPAADAIAGLENKWLGMRAATHDKDFRPIFKAEEHRGDFLNDPKHRAALPFINEILKNLLKPPKGPGPGTGTP